MSKESIESPFWCIGFGLIGVTFLAFITGGFCTGSFAGLMTGAYFYYGSLLVGGQKHAEKNQAPRLKPKPRPANATNQSSKPQSRPKHRDRGKSDPPRYR